LFVQDMFIVIMNITLARFDMKDKFLHSLSATCNMAFEFYLLYIWDAYMSQLK